MHTITICQSRIISGIKQERHSGLQCWIWDRGCGTMSSATTYDDSMPFWSTAQVSAVPLPIQLPAHVSEKATVDDPSVWAPVLSPALVVVAVWAVNQQMEDSFSVPGPCPNGTQVFLFI